MNGKLTDTHHKMILSSRLRGTFLTFNVDSWLTNKHIKNHKNFEFRSTSGSIRTSPEQNVCFISLTQTPGLMTKFCTQKSPTVKILKCMNFRFLTIFSHGDPRLLILVSIPTCIYKFKQTDLMLQAIESFHNQLIVVASELLGKQFHTNSKPITTCSINLSR